MHLYRVMSLGAILLALAGCYFTADDRNEVQKRVDADARCNAMGYLLPDNADYDRCLASERASGLGESPDAAIVTYAASNADGQENKNLSAEVNDHQGHHK